MDRTAGYIGAVRYERCMMRYFSRSDVSDMYKERLSASPFKLKVKISTPTVPDFGISAAYNETNKKEWFVTVSEVQTSANFNRREHY